MKKNKIYNTIFCLSPIILQPILPMVSCSTETFTIGRIDGTDWKGVKSGFFDSKDYTINMVSQSVTYTNGFKIAAKNLVIPDYVKYRGKRLKVFLGERCFEDDYFITGSVEFNKFIVMIPKKCFSNCFDIDTLIFKRPPKAFDDYAFNYCSINHIYIKTNGVLSDDFAREITIIGDFAFNNNDIQKQSITFGPSLKKIGSYSFANNYEIENINMNYCNNLITINDGAFAGCGSLQTVHLSPSTIYINDNAFSSCKFLERIYLPTPNMSLSLGDGAFYECTYFQSFSRPCKILSMSDTCFTYATHLTMQPWHPEYNLKFVPKHAFESCGYTYLSFPHGSAEDVGDYAFYGNQNLRIVDFSGLLPGDPVPNWSGRQIFDGIPQSAKCTLLIPYSTPDTEEWSAFCARQGMKLSTMWTIQVPNDGPTNINYVGAPDITIHLDEEGHGIATTGDFQFDSRVNFMPEWLTMSLSKTSTKSDQSIANQITEDPELWSCTVKDVDFINKTFKIQIELINGKSQESNFALGFTYRNQEIELKTTQTLHISVN